MNVASLSVLLALLAAPSGLAASLQGSDPAADDFERSSLGPDWTRYGGSTADIIGHSDLGAPTATWCFVGWTASAFAANQFSSAELSTGIDPDMLTQVYARRRASDLARYAFHYNGDPGQAQWEIKYDGVPTAQTRILARSTDPPPAPGDAIRIEVFGQDPVVIRGFHDDRLVLSASDSAPQRITTAGVAGVVARMKQGVPFRPPMPIFESWRGGSLYWIDLGRALGAARLNGSGNVLPGALVALAVGSARPSSPAALLLGSRAIDFPFAGGVLVPDPEIVVALPIDAGGAASIAFRLPASLPGGFSLYAQIWIVDPDGPFGFSATNALLGLVP
jgi:hypothetical protein